MAVTAARNMVIGRRHLARDVLLLGLVAALATPDWAVAANCKPQKLASPNGPGSMVGNDCARYEGEFKNGKLHGKGKVTESGGRTTEGRFMDGRLNGLGKIAYGDGRIADGEFVNGMLSGTGRFVWPDGRRFEGTFYNGYVSGPGKYNIADGTVFEGMFSIQSRSSPYLDGFGVRIQPDGSRLVGEFREGKPFGEMLFVRTDGTRERQTYAYRGKRVDAPGTTPAQRDQPQAGSQPAPQQPAEKTQPSQRPGDDKPAAGKTQDDLNRAIRGLRGIFGK